MLLILILFFLTCPTQMMIYQLAPVIERTCTLFIDENALRFGLLLISVNIFELHQGWLSDFINEAFTGDIDTSDNHEARVYETQLIQQAFEMVLHNPNNWHWVNKDASGWAKQWMEENLKSIIAEDAGVTAKVDKVVSMDGDVDVNQRKGKVITIFDVKLVLEYSGASFRSLTKCHTNCHINTTQVTPKTKRRSAEPLRFLKSPTILKKTSMLYVSSSLGRSTLCFTDFCFCSLT
jgi:hypothetical protein